ncbi:MAG: hypothetical protein R3A12_11395 [Ignavibacteria bacterium]
MNNIKAYNDVDVGFKETYKISLEQLGENWLLYLKRPTGGSESKRN